MVLRWPVSMSIPGVVSSDFGTAAIGATGGLLFSEYIASMTVGRFALAGGTALGASALTKGAIGAGSMLAASRMAAGSKAQIFLGFGSVICFVSILADVIKTYVPAVEAPAARLRTALRRRVVAPPPVVRPPVAVPVVRRAETPSGEALGGF